MRDQADRLMIVSNGSLDLFVYACDRVFQLNKTDVSPRPSDPVFLVLLIFYWPHLLSHLSNFQIRVSRFGFYTQHSDVQQVSGQGLEKRVSTITI